MREKQGGFRAERQVCQEEEIENFQKHTYLSINDQWKTIMPP